ncbi:MAG TPA: DNRLRE domain-containing protein [Marmoricola sp.]|nr:DNRLRE domain-containing protein [Marmoricola sp.]
MNTDAYTETLTGSAPAVMYDAPAAATGEQPTVVPVDTTVTQTTSGGVIKLKPDQAFLTAPPTTYPVTIDPPWSSDNPDDSWISTADKTASHPYDTTLYVGTDNKGTTKYRSFVRFNGNNEPWEGQTVIAAQLALRNFYSLGSDCNGTAVEVRRIADYWEPSSVTWNHQPTTSVTNAVGNSSRYGNTAACPAQDMVWTVTGMVQDMATWAANYGFRIAGADETLNQSYRRFRAAGYGTTKPRLYVTYDAAPNPPTTPVLTGSGQGRSCGSWVASRASMPSFVSTLTDPNGDNVYATMWTDRYTTAGWQNVSARNSDPAVSGAGGGTAVAFAMPTSDAQVNGVYRDGAYRVVMQTTDPYGLKSGYSGYCSFYLDSKNPLLNMTSDVSFNDAPPPDPSVEDEGAWIPHDSGYKLNLHLDPTGSEVVNDAGDPDSRYLSDVDYYLLSSDVPAINNKLVDPAEFGAKGDYSIDLGAAGMVGEHWVSAIAVDRCRQHLCRDTQEVVPGSRCRPHETVQVRRRHRLDAVLELDRWRDRSAERSADLHPVGHRNHVRPRAPRCARRLPPALRRHRVRVQRPTSRRHHSRLLRLGLGQGREPTRSHHAHRRSTENLHRRCIRARHHDRHRQGIPNVLGDRQRIGADQDRDGDNSDRPRQVVRPRWLL